jgi:hypothetical protein
VSHRDSFWVNAFLSTYVRGKTRSYVATETSPADKNEGEF